MARFIEARGWRHQDQQNYDLVLNIEHVTRIAADSEGRAVVYFVDGGAVTMTQTYNDFVRLLDSIERIESSWRTGKSPDPTATA